MMITDTMETLHSKKRGSACHFIPWPSDDESREYAPGYDTPLSPGCMVHQENKGAPPDPEPRTG